MDHSTRNYHAHGGSEWVVGGKLTFLPGATVEGGDGLFGDAVPGFIQMPNQPASEATTIAALKDNFNALLAALKAAGLMATDAPADEGGEEPEP